MNILIFVGLFFFILLCGNMTDCQATKKTGCAFDDNIMTATYTEIRSKKEVS